MATIQHDRSCTDVRRRPARALGRAPARRTGLHLCPQRRAESTWTWRQWEDRVRRCAGGLQALGVGRGDVVAFLDKNHPACVELSMAAASLGAANAIVNWRSAGDEVDYAVNDSGAKVLVVGSELMPTVNKIRENLTHVEKVIEVTPDGADGDEYEGLAAGLRAGHPSRRRLTRRRLPGHVLLGHHRPSQGRDADPRQHGRPHRQRPRRLGVRARRQEHGLDAALPRRRLVVRPVRHPRRRPQLHDPRPGRHLAGRRDPERRQPHLPGAGGAGPGAAGRAGRRAGCSARSRPTPTAPRRCRRRCCGPRWRPGPTPTSSRSTASPRCPAWPPT